MHDHSLMHEVTALSGVSEFLIENRHHRVHQTSFINFLHLLRLIASSLFNLRAWQSFSTPLFFVFLLPWNSLLHNPCISSPNHHLFATHSHTVAACFAVIPVLCRLFLISFSAAYLEIFFFLNATHPLNHSHLCSLKCHHIFFPYRPGLTFMQHAASRTTAHTTYIHKQPSSQNQWYVLTGKQWYQLPELIPTNSNSGLHSCISISIHTQHSHLGNITYLLTLLTLHWPQYPH